MYFSLLAFLAAMILVAAIPMAVIFAVMSPQAGTRVAPEKNPALRVLALMVGGLVAVILLAALLAM